MTNSTDALPRRNRRSGKRPSGAGKFYVADFETTQDPDDCRVWLWGLVNVFSDDYEVDWGTSIETFLERISVEFSTIYFHNLAFDGIFLLDRLLRDGYRHVDERVLKPGEFTSLISHDNKFYSVKVSWRNGGRTEFRDSLKKLPMSAAYVAKAFNLDESKGVIDYEAHRPVGYEPTPEEVQYVSDDVVIIARALRQQLNAGMKSLTVGADSLREYKEMTAVFSRWFPVLPLEVDTDIRRAYRGGFTYADPRFWKKVVGPGRVYDVNSLYPSVMYSKLLPYGEPIFRTGKPMEIPDFPLYVTTITITAKLKKRHIPCIQLRASSSRFIPTEYLREIPDPETVSLTNVDLELWQDHYDIDILAYHGTWYFKGAHDMFRDYIDKWNAVKVNSTGGMRVIAKLHLNSLYGKFATNPNVSGRIPSLENNVVKLSDGPEEWRDPVYTAMGVFITAYARNITIRAAQANYDTFAYADTDSLHLLVDEDPPGLDIDPARMGAWKHELTFVKGCYLRAKCYTEMDSEGRYHTHVAGLPESAAKTVTFDTFTDGTKFSGKLSPKRVPGGVVLVDVGFTLKT